MTGERLRSWRRALQLGLGLLWLLDAALQLQPYMFTTAFPREALAPAGPGNPGWVAEPVHWAAHLMATHIVITNAAFATAQLLIALGLFTRATVRVALAGSVVWALGVWWLGEGLGGLLVTPQSPVMGAPGAALLYALVAVLVWPSEREEPATDADRSVATASARRGWAARAVWLLLWGGFAVQSLQPANRSALHDVVAGMQDGEPGWLQAVNRGTAAALAHHGLATSVGLAALFALIAVAVFGSARVLRAGLVAGIAVAALIWLVGQDLGELATGQATDPNTGPLLILLAAIYWPVGPAGRWRPQRRTTVTSVASYAGRAGASA